MDNEITIVTAFYDIGRGNLPREKFGRVLPHYQHRNLDTYFEYFDRLAQMQNNLVVFTTEDLAQRIYDHRKKYGLQDRTQIVVSNSYMFTGMEVYKEKIDAIMASEEYRKDIVNPHFIEYWHSDYVLVNIFKAFYVDFAIQSGLVKTELTAWIDFGYCRQDATLPITRQWKYHFNKEKIHFFTNKKPEPDRAIKEIIDTGDVYIMGCHIVAGTKKWQLLKQLMHYSMDQLILNNMIDDDQTLLLISYLLRPEEFELRHVNHINDNWFVIFREYNELP